MQHDTKVVIHGLKVIEDLTLDPQCIYVHPMATYKLITEVPLEHMKDNGVPDDLPPDFAACLERNRLRDATAQG